MNTSSIKFFKQFFATTQPLLEELVNNICKELGHEDKTDEIIQKFLTEDRKKLTTVLKKKSGKVSKRKKSAYSMFLADKDVITLLKERHPEINPENNPKLIENKNYIKILNKKKGEYWRNEVIGTDLYEKYKEKADNENLEN